MKRIKIILGSVRTNRAGKSVADWVIKEAQKYKGDLVFDYIDLKELNLPFMDEPLSPMASDAYIHDHTKFWSKIIKEADGLVFITPEYNHGYSPVLKNAIDFLYKEWLDKPVLLVGYGGSGARDSIRQLREILVFTGMKPLESQIGIGKIWEAFNGENELKPENIRGNIQQLLAELEKSLVK